MLNVSNSDNLIVIPEKEYLDKLVANPQEYLTDDLLLEILKDSQPKFSYRILDGKKLLNLKFSKCPKIFFHPGLDELRTTHRVFRSIYLGYLPKIAFTGEEVERFFDHDILKPGLAFFEIENHFKLGVYRELVAHYIPQFVQKALDSIIEARLKWEFMDELKVLREVNTSLADISKNFSNPFQFCWNKDVSNDYQDSSIYLFERIGAPTLSGLPDKFSSLILAGIFTILNNNSGQLPGIVLKGDKGEVILEGEMSHLNHYLKPFHAQSLSKILEMRVSLGNYPSAWVEQILEMLDNGFLLTSLGETYKEKQREITTVVSNLFSEHYGIENSRRENLVFILSLVDKLIKVSGLDLEETSEGNLLRRELLEGQSGKILYAAFDKDYGGILPEDIYKVFPKMFVADFLKLNNFKKGFLLNNLNNSIPLGILGSWTFVIPLKQVHSNYGLKLGRQGGDKSDLSFWFCGTLSDILDIQEVTPNLYLTDLDYTMLHLKELFLNLSADNNSQSALEELLKSKILNLIERLKPLKESQPEEIDYSNLRRYFLQ